MTISEEVAKHIKEVHFGGNWTDSNLKDTLADVTWEESNQEINGLNTILQLTYHINYFIKAQLDVLNGKPLTSKDTESFDHPPINSQEDWEAFITECWKDGEELSRLIDQLSEDRMWEPFVEPQYGHYFRNLFGAVEHTHYHLGQIAIMKKLIRI